MIKRGSVIRGGSRNPMIDTVQQEQQTFVLTAEDTDGRLEWIESTVNFGGGPPCHLHHTADEAITILEGEIKFKVDNELVDLGPGDTLFVPRGVPHTFTNVHRDQPVRLVGVYAPAGLQAFFRVWRELSANGMPDESAMAELAARYGMELMGPPLAVELGLSGMPG